MLGPTAPLASLLASTAVRAGESFTSNLASLSESFAGTLARSKSGENAGTAPVLGGTVEQRQSVVDQITSLLEESGIAANQVWQVRVSNGKVDAVVPESNEMQQIVDLLNDDATLLNQLQEASLGSGPVWLEIPPPQPRLTPGDVAGNISERFGGYPNW